jgi:aromatic ring-cleaving dioxygenase
MMTDHTPEPHSIAAIHSYHAHIYYDPATTRGDASAVRHGIAARFPVQLGRWHDDLVGPHTRSMYQVAFTPDVFPRLVPWLMLNRRGLAVLVHPNTDDTYADHVTHALWLGEILPLKPAGLPRSLRELGEAPEPVIPNTAPHLPA